MQYFLLLFNSPHRGLRPITPNPKIVIHSEWPGFRIQVSSHLTNHEPIQSHTSTGRVAPFVTLFHYLSHSLVVGSSFLAVLKILSRFSLKLRKQARATQFPVKKYCIISSPYKKNVILDSETATRNCPVNG